MAIVVVALLAAATLWGRQQQASRWVAEARAEAAEAQLARAEASLSAVNQALAVASATAAAQASEPGTAIQQKLELLLAAYKDPTQPHLRALTEAFGPSALSVVQTEAEHLISAGLHLGGESGFTMEVLSTTPRGPDTAEVRTREVWTYDERDASDRRARCIREEGEQTYTLKQVNRAWLVDDIELGSSRRSDC